jgi:type IV pilus assembly protein PilO
MKKSKENYSAKIQPLFEQIGRLSKLQRILMVIVVFSLLIGGFVFLSIKPRYEQISVVNKKISDTDKELATAKKKASELEGLKQEWAKKEVEFQKIMAALPDKQEIPSLLGDISASGRNVGLIFNRFAPQAEVFKDFYAEIPVAISISGTYDRLNLFFSKVAEMSRVVNIRNINMQLMSSKSSKKEAEITGDVLVECTAVTYRFLSEAEQKAKQQQSDGKKKKAAKKK